MKKGGTGSNDFKRGIEAKAEESANGTRGNPIAIHKPSDIDYYRPQQRDFQAFGQNIPGLLAICNGDHYLCEADTRSKDVTQLSRPAG
jgi:hypothetical protein